MPLRTNKKPFKPLLAYDGECPFCRFWAERWCSMTGHAVEYVPFQELGSDFPEIDRRTFRREIKLIDVDGRVYGGGRATAELLRFVPKGRWLAGLYHLTPGAGVVASLAYRAVARNRNRLYKPSVWLFGDKTGNETCGPRACCSVRDERA